MFDHYKKTHITESQIYLTRKCNSRCWGCNLPKTGKNLRELSPDQWEEVFLNLQRLGIKTVKLMGGEPTEAEDLNDLLNLIRFVKEETDIRLALLSNSKWDKERWFDKFCRSGLFGYFASVDTITTGAIDQDSLEKSQKGYRMLLDLKNAGTIPLLAANVVLTRENQSQISDLVVLLSEEGFYVNICPIQCYSSPPTYEGKPIEYHFRKSENEYAFIETDIPKLQTVVKQLVSLQKKDVKIAVPASYLLDIPRLGLHGGTWKCNRLSQLRVDVDGIVMICNEFRGNSPQRFNISKPIGNVEQWTEKFVNYWYNERLKYDCQCYWSCFLQAEKNIEIGLLEFGYFDNPRYYEIGLKSLLLCK